MPNNLPVRPLRLPDPVFDQIKVPRTRQPARDWFRVHPIQFKALFFSLNPGHRFSHAGCPYQFLYMGADIDTCLFERFGDTAYDGKKIIPRSLWRNHGLSKLRMPELKVCDLTHAGTLSALQVDLSSLMHPDLTVSQVWGLAIQKHPADFEAIKFKSRFNGQSCLALFNRNGIEGKILETALGDLSQNSAAVDWLDKHQISLY
jgi:hypothetical protein